MTADTVLVCSAVAWVLLVFAWIFFGPRPRVEESVWQEPLPPPERTSVRCPSCGEELYR